MNYTDFNFFTKIGQIKSIEQVHVFELEIGDVEKYLNAKTLKVYKKTKQ